LFAVAEEVDQSIVARFVNGHVVLGERRYPDTAEIADLLGDSFAELVDG
jgi:hypothetical protein